MTKAQKVVMTPIASSSISAIGFADSKLWVRFTPKEGEKGPGDLFSYANVPSKIADLLIALAKANDFLKHHNESEVSIGSMFHYLIKVHKEKYPYSKEK